MEKTKEDEMKRTELKGLYEKYWGLYLTNIIDNNQIDTAYPYLIKLPENYEENCYHVMICGQETYGWGGEFYNNKENATIDALQELYDGFANKGGYNSPYWNFVHYLRDNCENVSFVINNIVKIGKKYEAGCDDAINELTLKYFPVFREELNILRPDMIVFLTHNRYDNRIKAIRGDFQVGNMENSVCLSKLVFSDMKIPLAIRTCHPGYLRRIHKEKEVRSILAEMINDKQTELSTKNPKGIFQNR